jgi:hypothetical protein
MYMQKKFLYLIFTFTIIFGLALGWFSYVDKIDESVTPAIKLQNLSGTIIKQNHTEQLLSFVPIKVVSVNKKFFIIGDDSLSFKTDTVQSVITYLPNKPDVWKNYWSALLGESGQTDNSTRWSIALMKLRIALFAEWEILSRQSIWAKLSDEQKLTYAIVGAIHNNPDSVFFLEAKTLRKSTRNSFKVMDDNGLIVVNQQERQVRSQNIQYYVLSLTLFLSGLAGILFTIKMPAIISPIQKNNNEERLETTDHELAVSKAVETGKDGRQEAEIIKTYMKNFLKRYGDLYTNIELLTEYPADEPGKQKIKQNLIEMGLHAHSFARAYLFDYLKRPKKEPNILLIYEAKEVKDLDAKLYKILSLDGQETNKRYRYLAKIIAEMTVNSLEGALLNDTYVSAETFKHLK